ncbi:hypothetical protein JKP88DRAFT_220150 [Tribonema minus]|uniref:Secreted protein n=1 Tax=Tribonema minus TaxID=303371 RepID=A0A835Z5S1_9STRA|nr:hypothetical protein JKP88DRAFT_220150 [Tribonema minus]
MNSLPTTLTFLQALPVVSLTTHATMPCSCTLAPLGQPSKHMGTPLSISMSLQGSPRSFRMHMGTLCSMTSAYLGQSSKQRGTS